MLLYFVLNACATFVNKLRGGKKKKGKREHGGKKRAFERVDADTCLYVGNKNFSKETRTL